MVGNVGSIHTFRTGWVVSVGAVVAVDATAVAVGTTNVTLGFSLVVEMAAVAGPTVAVDDAPGFEEPVCAGWQADMAPNRMTEERMTRTAGALEVL
jgi:hypothetical protein